MSYPGNINNVQVEGHPENSDISVDYDIVAYDNNHIYAQRRVRVKPDYKRKYKEEKQKKSFWRCLCASFCCLFCCFPC